MSLENFLALLEYLYTDHAPIEEGDSVGILELSNKYVLPRLMALCELYISKEVERATAESITQADVDVVGEWCTNCLGTYVPDSLFTVYSNACLQYTVLWGHVHI